MTKTISMAVAGLMAASALAGCSQAPKVPVCDRNCLIKLTDDYVAGLAKHSAEGLPMEDNVAFVENIKPMKVGEGLWKDTTGGATAFSRFWVGSTKPAWPVRPRSRSTSPTRSGKPPAGSG